MNAPVTPAQGALRQLLSDELEQALPAEVSHFAQQLSGGALAVLFYGSALRSGDLHGLLDFYVLFDKLRDSRQGLLARAGNAALPPNVFYAEHEVDGVRLRAKVAVMSVRQFARAMRSSSLDTTLWARFAQPVACAWRRDSATLPRVLEPVAQAVQTAASWAATLGPEQGSARDYWQALFRHTYAAELRVESGDRPGQLLSDAAARYHSALTLAWSAQGIAYETCDGGELRPMMDAASRAEAAVAWRRRQRLGKLLNAARLSKAAFTFEGGADYLVWKIERHTGQHIELTHWQRRHPTLAAPGVLKTLYRRGILKRRP